MKRLLIILAIWVCLPVYVFAQNGATSYPPQLDTDCTLFPVKNGATAKLKFSIAANATSLIVDSTALFPACGYLLIGGRDVIHYSHKTSNTFNNLTLGPKST